MFEDILRAFVEKHIHLIEAKNFEKLYNIVDTEENYDGADSLYHNCGKFTDLLYSVGLDPLEGSTKIYPNMFVRSDIDKFVFPQGIKEIGNAAFYSCPNLDNIIIPEGIIEIPFECFDDTYLEWIQIPDSVQKIAPDAFAYDNIFHIKCNMHSYADQWAKDHDIPVEYIS